jgi:uncharacterized phage protein gp47/JayE
MEPSIDRVMQAYTMIANLTPEQVQTTCERLTAHGGADEKALAALRARDI